MIFCTKEPNIIILNIKEKGSHVKTGINFIINKIKDNTNRVTGKLLIQ